jgi:hypothetical protein
MTYKTSLDNLAKLVTMVVSIIFAIIIVVQFSLINDEVQFVPIFTTTLFLFIYFGTFFFRPVSYILTPDQLIIHRPLSNIKILRTDIKTVEHIDKNDLKWSIRIFGVGGLFGYWGKFRNKKMGSMTWYATRRNNVVLVTTIHQKKIILTPNEPEKFVTAFNLQAL